MAIAEDATSSATASSSSSLTFSHTCTGSERLLLVAVSHVVIFDDVPGTQSVTYNGVSMTSIASTNISTGFGRVLTQLFRLVAPATGAHDIVVTFSKTAYLGPTCAISYTGVDQTTPVDTGSTDNDATGGTSIVISSASGDLVLDCYGLGVSNVSEAVGADQTVEVSTDTGMGLYISSEPGGASITMSWSNTDNGPANQVAVNINAASGGGGTAVKDIIGGGIIAFAR